MSGGTNPDAALCPVTFALDVFGDRWTLRVLRSILLDHRYSYKDLLASNSGIATNVLAERLSRLEARKLVTKTRDPTDARRFLYRPTERAIGTIPILLEMMIWSARHGNGHLDPSLLRRFETDRRALIAELEACVRDWNLEAQEG